MARIVSNRTVPVQIHGVETLNDCIIHVRTSVKVGTFMALDQNDARSLIPFLAEIMPNWEGFDMPCDEEHFKELTTEEMQAIMGACMEVLRNPPKANSENG